MTGARRRLDDSGSAELMFLILIPVLLLALGIVVDFGGYMRAKDEAGWCAQQSARAAAEHMDLNLAQTSGVAVVTGSGAVAAAEQTAAASGMTGTATFNGDGSVTATCSTDYKVVVLVLPGATTWGATESATSRPARGVTQEQRP